MFCIPTLYETKCFQEEKPRLLSGLNGFATEQMETTQPKTIKFFNIADALTFLNVALEIL